ncbi:cystathionine gamma-synthase family protein [Woodsholea maritima]|uniref:cystathionine gamma-synthase family protein n=1 Tax=Woodsholea maritima TaxID=240237 RepID=UPI00035E79F3|nr:cystathionine gamma-synthase family protein [Woodsholea maritima]
MSKPDKTYRKRALGDHVLSPETMMMSYGFDPKLSEGSIKPPVFLTSTFAYASAEEGAAFFRVMGGRAQAGDPETAGLLYSRFNNPNMEVLEDRLTLFDKAEDAVVFSSGMSAISTAIMAHSKAGDVVLHSTPLYGGTETMIRNVLPNYAIAQVEFVAMAPEAEVKKAMEEALTQGRISVIMAESPTNPTNEIVDFALLVALADEIEQRQGHRPIIMIDNTFLGPIAQHPLEQGIDMVLYSLTKYVGGHSDLVAGAALGSDAVMAPVRKLRSAIGTNLDPHSCWMLLRSLETVKIRMEAAFNSARIVAEFLRDHPKVQKVRYLGFLEEGSRDHTLHTRQATMNGSTFAFDIKGGEDAAFRFQNALKVIKLAVSLGGTESLISHPGSTTHSGVDPLLRARLGFDPGMVRLSVGLENPQDIIADLNQALEHA